MDGIFLEFENENSLRSYPFASGCNSLKYDSTRGIPSNVFVDAALYPINSYGGIYLSSVSQDGVFNISDSTGVIMSGRAAGNLVEMFDASDFSRHTGTLVAYSEGVLEEFAGRGVERVYTAEETLFSSSCVFPVTVDGVTSIEVGNTGSITGSVEFTNSTSADVRVSSGTLENGKSTIRFDVLPRLVAQNDTSIKRIICVVDGKTPFRISRDDGMYNTIMLQLDGIDKEAVCSAAHRENSFEMVDTCSDGGQCEPEIPGEEVQIPDSYQLVEVFIPPDETGVDGGIPEGCDNAFFLVSPNISGYANPISITLVDGAVSPKTNDPEIVIDGYSAELAEGEMLDSVTSKGVVLQVPGLSGGTV